MKKFLLLIVSFSFLFFVPGCNGGAHNHTYSEEWSADETYHWHAATCGHDEVADKDVHSFGDYSSNNDATTESDGTKSRTCSICSYIETVPDAGTKLHTHTFEEKWVRDSQYHWHMATCEHKNVQGNKAEHIWDNGVITTPVTCTTSGIKLYTCSICGAQKTEEIPAKGHTFASEWVITNTHHWHVATCVHTTEISDYAEHTWDDGVVTKQPTCLVNGVKTYTCKYCKTTKNEALTDGHVWNEGVVTKVPTCFEAGEKTLTCKICKETKKVSIPSSHTYESNWSYDEINHWHKAICEHKDCTSDFEPHQFKENIIKEPTDTTEGEKVVFCVSCGYSYRIRLNKKTDITPPANVSDLHLIPSEVVDNIITTTEGVVTLRWKNPKDADFEKVVISYDTSNAYAQNKTFGHSKSIIGLPSASVDYFYIDGLTQGAEYTFNIKTYDVKGNYSNGITVTDTPRFLTVEEVEAGIRPLDLGDATAISYEQVFPWIPKMYVGKDAIGNIEVIQNENLSCTNEWFTGTDGKWKSIEYDKYQGFIIHQGITYYLKCISDEDMVNTVYSPVCEIECATERTKKIGWIAYQKGTKTEVHPDYKPEYGTPIGIVFMVDDEGNPSRIIHLAPSVHLSFSRTDEEYGGDSRYDIVYNKTFDTSDVDGSGNYAVVKESSYYISPALDYCASVDTGGKTWYLPAIYELRCICFNLDCINFSLDRLAKAMNKTSDEIDVIYTTYDPSWDSNYISSSQSRTGWDVSIYACDLARDGSPRDHFVKNQKGWVRPIAKIE